MTLTILAISGIGSHVVLRSALISRDGKADDNRVSKLESVCGIRDHTVVVDKTRLVGFVRPKEARERPTVPRVPEQNKSEPVRAICHLRHYIGNELSGSQAAAPEGWITNTVITTTNFKN